MNPAKTAEPIEVQFGVWTRVGPRNHVLGGKPGSPTGMGTFEGKRAAHGDATCLQLLPGQLVTSISNRSVDETTSKFAKPLKCCGASCICNIEITDGVKKCCSEIIVL